MELIRIYYYILLPWPNSLNNKSLLVSSRLPFLPLLTFLPPFPKIKEVRRVREEVKRREGKEVNSRGSEKEK